MERVGIHSRPHSFLFHNETGATERIESSYKICVPSSYSHLVVWLHGACHESFELFPENAVSVEQVAEKYGCVILAPLGFNKTSWYGCQETCGHEAVERQTDGRCKRLDFHDMREGDDKWLDFLGIEVEAMKAAQECVRDTWHDIHSGEKGREDVLNAVKAVQKEFGISSKRTHLLGHSMGGSGALYFSASYPEIFGAGTGLIAPALFWKRAVMKEAIKKMYDASRPLCVIVGSQDPFTKDAAANAADAMGSFDYSGFSYMEWSEDDHCSILSKVPDAFEHVFAHYALCQSTFGGS